MPDPTYAISMEFVAGSFTEITGDCLRFTTSRELGFYNDLKMGRATLILDNTDRVYSPNNSASSYYPNLKPNRAVKIQATYSGSTRQIFNGFIDRFTIDPALTARIATIEASDRLKRINQREINLPMILDTKVGSLVSIILSHAGLAAADYSVDAINDSISFASFDHVQPSFALGEIMVFGNYKAYVGKDGKLNFKDRNYDAGLLVLDSYVGSSHGLSYYLDEDKIINSTVVEGQPRKKASSVSSVAWIDQPISVPASSGVGFFLGYVDPDTLEQNTPADELVTPVSSSDYKTNTATDGGGTDRTSQASVQVTFFATSAICSLYNGSGDTVYITKFQLRGKSVQKQPRISVRREVSSSQTQYGKRNFTLTSDLINSQNYATDYADYLISRYKDPQDEVRAGYKNFFPNVLDRELGEIINVVNSDAGVNSTWIITSIEHEVSLERGLEHQTNYGLLVTYQAAAEYLILDADPNGRLDSRRLGF